MATNVWIPALDKLLRRWKKQIGIRGQEHKRLCEVFQSRHYIIGIPCIILGLLTTTGTFGTFANCDPTMNISSVLGGCTTNEYIRLVLGILGAFYTVLAGLMTFLDYKGCSESHKTAAANYGALYREIDALLLMNSIQRGDPVITLQTLRSKYDDLVRNAPSIPKKYDVELTYEVVSTNRTLPIPPNAVDLKTSRISSGIDGAIKHAIANATDTSGTTNRDDDKNTSDEEVCIDFDLDDATQQSYRNVLEFEMSRLNNK